MGVVHWQGGDMVSTGCGEFGPRAGASDLRYKPAGNIIAENNYQMAA